MLNWWMKAERRMEKVLNGYEMEYSENSPRQSEQGRDEWTKEQGYLLSYVKNSQGALCQPLKKQTRTMQQQKQERKKGKKKKIPISFLSGNVTLSSVAAMDAFKRTKGNEQEV